MLGGSWRRRIAVIIALACVLMLAACGAQRAAVTPTGHSRPLTQRLRSAEVAHLAVLDGIVQSGQRLGDAGAPVQVTLYGDLECDACRQLVLGRAFAGLIAHQVKRGEVAITYRSSCTATCTGELPAQAVALAAAGLGNDAGAGAGLTPGAGQSGVVSGSAASLAGVGGFRTFVNQQAAAYAAGLQDRFWQFAMLFLASQRIAGSGYVTSGFLDGLAQRTPSLVYRTWSAQRHLRSLVRAVARDDGVAMVAAPQGTPTLVLRGPGGTKRLNGPSGISYARLSADIRSVS